MHDSFFRELDDAEKAKFRAWARANYDPASLTKRTINPLWHPEVRDECLRMKLAYYADMEPTHAR